MTTNDAKHTVEPWHVGVCQSLAMNIYDECGIGVASSPLIKTNEERLANARRIVACVNACAGIADPEKVIGNIKAIGLDELCDENAEMQQRITDLGRQLASADSVIRNRHGVIASLEAQLPSQSKH